MRFTTFDNPWFLPSNSVIVNYGIWYQILGFMESLDTSESTDKNSGNECKIRLTSKILVHDPAGNSWIEEGNHPQPKRVNDEWDERCETEQV